MRANVITVSQRSLIELSESSSSNVHVYLLWIDNKSKPMDDGGDGGD